MYFSFNETLGGFVMLGVLFTGRCGAVVRLSVVVFLLGCIFSGVCLATPKPVTCDPKGGIWNFGMEWEADTCVPKDMTADTSIHLVNTALVCTNSIVQKFSALGDNSLGEPPSFFINSAVSQGYRVFRNTEGTHIMIVDPRYTGLIAGKDITAYAPGQVYTDFFKRGFVLPPVPICKKDPECTTCPCPLEVRVGSTVNIISGRLSHNQELFSVKGGQLPLSFTLYYKSMPFAPSAIGNGWSHGYEQSLQVLANGTLVVWGDGKERDYRLIAGVYTPPRGDYSTLVKNVDNSYTLTEKNGLTRSFDSSGRITALSDRNGNSTSFVYTSGKLTSVTDANSRTALLAYDANGILSTITDPLGAVYTFNYTNGLLSSISAPDGGSWTYIYGTGNMLTTKTDPGGNSTSYAFDASNRVTSSVDPQSQTRSFGFSAGAGDPGKVPDLYPPCVNLADDGITIIYNITDASGICIPTVMPIIEKNSGNWTYTYEYMSETLKSVTDPYNNTTSYTHDAQGNMMTKSEPGIGITFYTYDANGNTTSIKDPLGNVTSYTYNSLGRSEEHTSE